MTIAIGLLASLALAAPAGALFSPTTSLPIPVLSQLPHGPIAIDGDDDFCADPFASGVVNCSDADGSAGNPFEIRGWAIEADAEGLVPALSISHTTLHVVVSDNLFVAPADSLVAAVVFADVRNAALHGNLLRSGRGPALVVDGFTESPEGSSATFPGFDENSFVAGLLDGARVTLVRMSAIESATIRAATFTGAQDSFDDIDTFLAIANSERVAIVGSQFVGANGTAIRASAVETLEVASTFVRDVAVGLQLAGPGRVTVTAADLSRVGSGIRAEDLDRLTVLTVAIDDDFPCTPSCLDKIGILAERTSLVMGNVTVTGFDTGVAWDGTTNAYLIAACNVVRDNGVGFLVHDNGTESFLLNALEGNGLALRNTGTSEFQATHNWWGSATGPSENAPNGYAGKVKVNPFLTAPPAICEPA